MKKSIAVFSTQLILLLVFLCFSPSLGFSFKNEPDGFAGLKWGIAPTEEIKKSRFVESSENDKVLKSYYWEPEDIDKIENKAFSLNRNESVFIFINDMFFGLQITMSGIEAMERVSEQYLLQFGIPVSEYSDEIVNTPEFKLWNGEHTAVIISFDKDTNLVTIAMFSQILLGKHNEVFEVVSPDEHDDQNENFTNTDAPMCYDKPLKPGC